MVSKNVLVRNEKGIHLRTAGVFCEEALKFKSKIQIRCKEKTLNAKSILGLLGAGVKFQDTIEIICEGSDEKEALKRLILLVENKLGEK